MWIFCTNYKLTLLYVYWFVLTFNSCNYPKLPYQIDNKRASLNPTCRNNRSIVTNSREREQKRQKEPKTGSGSSTERKVHKQTDNYIQKHWHSSRNEHAKFSRKYFPFNASNSSSHYHFTNFRKIGKIFSCSRLWCTVVPFDYITVIIQP